MQFSSAQQKCPAKHEKHKSSLKKKKKEASVHPGFHLFLVVFKHANNCKVTLSTFLFGSTLCGQVYCTTPQVFLVSLTQVYKINQPISVPLQTFVKEWVVLKSSLNMTMVPKEDITVTTPTTFVKFLPSMIFSCKCFYSKVSVRSHKVTESHGVHKSPRLC